MSSSESVDGNEWLSLGQHTNISVQRMHEKRNTLTDNFQSYETLYEIPTHRTDIQTAKSTISADVCLTVFLFHLPHIRLNIFEKETWSRKVHILLNYCMLIAL
jgi:hypothetical protein